MNKEMEEILALGIQTLKENIRKEWSASLLKSIENMEKEKSEAKDILKYLKDVLKVLS